MKAVALIFALSFVCIAQIDSSIVMDKVRKTATDTIAERPVLEMSAIIKDHQVTKRDTVEIIGRLLKSNGNKDRLFRFIYIDTVRSQTGYKTMLRNVGITIGEAPAATDTAKGK